MSATLSGIFDLLNTSVSSMIHWKFSDETKTSACLYRWKNVWQHVLGQSRCRIRRRGWRRWSPETQTKTFGVRRQIYQDRENASSADSPLPRKHLQLHPRHARQFLRERPPQAHPEDLHRLVSKQLVQRSCHGPTLLSFKRRPDHEGIRTVLHLRPSTPQYCHQFVVIFLLQIYYYDEHDINGFLVYKNNNDILLQCTTMTHSVQNVTKGNTCFTAAAEYLNENDQIHLEDLSQGRGSIFEPGKSFFGVIKLGDVKI
jgi:hypothetical protein